MYLKYWRALRQFNEITIQFFFSFIRTIHINFMSNKHSIRYIYRRIKTNTNFYVIKINALR